MSITPAIYRFLLHLARDAAEAEDLTQETFAAAWRKAGAFEGRSALGTWLHRIAYGKFVDARRAGRRSAALTERLRRRGSAASPCPVEEAARDDEARRLYAALERVDPADRVLLVLHYFQGLSYREMAEVTGEPTGTVKWRTSAALDRMRTLLTAEETHGAKSRRTTKRLTRWPTGCAACRRRPCRRGWRRGCLRRSRSPHVGAAAARSWVAAAVLLAAAAAALFAVRLPQRPPEPAPPVKQPAADAPTLWRYEQALRRSDADAAVVLNRAMPPFEWPVAGPVLLADERREMPQ